MPESSTLWHVDRSASSVLSPGDVRERAFGFRHDDSTRAAPGSHRYPLLWFVSDAVRDGAQIGRIGAAGMPCRLLQPVLEDGAILGARRGGTQVFRFLPGCKDKNVARRSGTQGLAILPAALWTCQKIHDGWPSFLFGVGALVFLLGCLGFFSKAHNALDALLRVGLVVESGDHRRARARPFGDVAVIGIGSKIESH